MVRHIHRLGNRVVHLGGCFVCLNDCVRCPAVARRKCQILTDCQTTRKGGTLQEAACWGDIRSMHVVHSMLTLLDFDPPLGIPHWP